MSYTTPTDTAVGRIEDAAGHAAASFGGQEVVNNTEEAVIPLTARFEEEPDSHNGTDAFTFRIAFSEPVETGYATLRDHSLEATGGSVIQARRVDGRSDLWEIQVEPDSNGKVFVALPADRACDVEGAICTGEGKRLYNRLELTVPGPNTPATGAPAIGGTAQVGETLTADTSGIADADGLTGAAFSYQWLADGADIQDAIGSAYTLQASDAGKTIKVRVTFTDNAGNEETLTSAATAPVAAPPPPPKNLRAVLGEGAVKLTWEAPDDATVTGYRIDRRHSGEGRSAEQVLVEDTCSTDTGYTDKSAQKDAEYQYRVSSRNEAGAGEASEWVNTEPASETAPEPTDRPHGLLAVAGEGVVTLTWNAPEDANAVFNYRILRHRPEEGEPEPLVYVEYTNSRATSFIDTAVELGVLYVYRVQAADAFGYLGEASGPASVRVPESNRPATGAPAINGTAQVGETLTVDTSGIADEDGLDDVTFSHQWAANDGNADTDIAGATGATYTLVSDDEGKTIKVRVTLTDDAGNPESRTSEATAAVTAPEGASPGPLAGFTLVDATDQTVLRTLTDGSAVALEDPANGSYGIRADTESGAVIGSVRLELTGAKTVSQTENLTPYSLYGDDSDGLHGEALPTGTYNLRATAYSERALGGDTLGTLVVSFTVTAAQDQQGSGHNSPATGAPTISGTAQVGETLTADPSGITDADGLDNVSYAYQWLRNDGTTDTDIQGATSATYTLADADQGKAIKVRVSFTDDANNQEMLTSTPTAAVAARPNTPATGAPTISGTAQVEQTLTVETSGIADSDGLDNASLSYQWVSNDGNADADIQDATNVTYTLTDDDVGKTIRVRVTFTDDRGHGETLISAATDAVAGPPSEPFTASLESTPEAHDGETPFTFELRFSEEFSLSYKTLRDHGSR